MSKKLFGIVMLAAVEFGGVAKIPLTILVDQIIIRSSLVGHPEAKLVE